MVTHVTYWHTVEYTFPPSVFFQALITLLDKVYKTITIKYNLKQNVTIFSSEAHGFFNILTANLVNNLKDIHPPFRKRALSLNKTSSKFLPPIITENPLDQPSTTTENPLDRSSFTSDDQLDNLDSSETRYTKPRFKWVTSPSPFCTKLRLRKLPKIARVSKT